MIPVASLAALNLAPPWQNQNLNEKIAEWNRDKQDLDHATFRQSEMEMLLGQARAEAAKIRAQASAREASLLRALDEAQADNQRLRFEQEGKWYGSKPARLSAPGNVAFEVSGKGLRDGAAMRLLCVFLADS
jgi:hypothetical protein